MYILIIEKIAFADGLDIGQGKDRREKERKVEKAGSKLGPCHPLKRMRRL